MPLRNTVKLRRMATSPNRNDVVGAGRARDICLANAKPLHRGHGPLLQFSSFRATERLEQRSFFL
jgi:hypothetical protein